MKMPTLITRKKKLRAATARRSRNLGLPEEMDYEQMAEPNMKLSRALLIVLLLHIVAVAGIVAFNTIKTRENFTPATPETTAPSTTPATPALAADSVATAPNESSTAAARTETKVVEETSAAPAKSSIKDSGKIYTVARGDNPVTIARRLHVAEGDLLELNQITDPRKLQINQKLRIPERRTSSKEKSD